ncbi:MAG: DsrE/DsrF/DrsH-like family protein [Planctomycetaceae bacterium]|jgi:NADPH-dependent 2,4-dienoyl-CoA reductase/sulfur reductase-like enzyme/peroxiredoxin family protein/rhodanese-related sulfurtransferase/TusA-related sulfurtransferase|nr:DsrE/DsrF/DrsH-like family protein [Planctomycetaceae bacterium]
MKQKQKILIVGGVAGGASAAARLRRLSESAEIIILERGEFISFANCGLPYYIGGEISEKSALILQTPQSFKSRYSVDVRIRHEAVAINRNNKTVSVKNHQTNEIYTESYDKLILSPGAKPICPDEFQSERIFTIRNIPDTYRVKNFIDTKNPQHAVIVGGGYIGLETAENLHRAGLKVAIVQRSDHVLPTLDFDTACDIHRHIESKGVQLLLNHEVKSISEQNGNLIVTLNRGNEIVADTIVTEMMIFAIGVQPDSVIAQEAGLTVDSRGAIIVSETMQTSDPDIYAIGDAISVVDYVTEQPAYIPLAGPANKQGRIVADRIGGIDSRYSGTQGSSILRVFDMTVASTGINETVAKKKGLNYEKIFLWSTSHAGYYPGATNMSVKIIFERETGKLLGTQIAGYDGVDKRCDIIATAIRAKMTASDLAQLELCYAPPYSSAKDPVNMAGFVIENILTGKVKIFHWHDIEKLQKSNDIILLDVRTPTEYDNGHIDGFINIPVDELRGRLDEIDKSKKIYVTCQVGVRGYAATRILVQNDFDAYNLSGGFRLWRSIFGAKTKLPSCGMIHGEQHSVPQSGNTFQQSGDILKSDTIKVDACGLQCPEPIMKLSVAVNSAKEGDVIEIKTTDSAFSGDVEGFCRRTGNVLLDVKDDKGIFITKIRKGNKSVEIFQQIERRGKNFILFSGDLDKAIAVFIMANAAAALGRKASIFFTFWGLNILRRPEKVFVRKDFLSQLFGWMMPRGSKKLPLSKMNMGGLGAKLIRGIMRRKNVSSLEELIQSARNLGVDLIACSMSMEVMGIKPEELIDGVQLGGATAMLAFAEESDMSLFI